MTFHWHDGYTYGVDRHGDLLAQAAHWRRTRATRRITARERIAAALVAVSRRLAAPRLELVLEPGDARTPQLCAACGASLPGFGAGRPEEAPC